MNDDPREPISLVAETPDTVTLRRTDYEALLSELEDAEDRAAVLEHRLAKAAGTATETLSLEEATLLIEGENPVKFWREKRGLSQQSLASAAEISKSLLSEIENGTKTGSVETLRKLSHALNVDLDTLVP
jgi:ribosome-binding protein aMBF1 (putative translation factor)